MARSADGERKRFMLLTVIFDAPGVVDVGGLENILDQAICILQGCNWHKRVSSFMAFGWPVGLSGAHGGQAWSSLS
jgi:hypothetical protein